MIGVEIQSFNITEYNLSKTIPRFMTGVQLRPVHTRPNAAEMKQIKFSVTGTTPLKEINCISSQIDI